MTLPGSVVVGPVRYKITDSAEDWHAYEQDEGGRHRDELGLAWHSRALILLNPKDPDAQVRRVTVLHEVCHAIIEAVGHSNGKLSEEQWVRLFSPLLLDTLRRNPDLTRWLLEPDR
jgi:hypothetical protein